MRTVALLWVAGLVAIAIGAFVASVSAGFVVSGVSLLVVAYVAGRAPSESS